MAQIDGLLLNDDAAAATAAAWVEAALTSSGVSPEQLSIKLGHQPCEFYISSRLTKEAHSSTMGICFAGHSTERAWCSDDGILLDSRRAACLAGVDVLAVSCSSTAKLGRAAVSAGARSYAGFRAKVVWDPWVPRSKDAVSRCVHELVVAFVKSTMNGNGSSELHKVPERHYLGWCTLHKEGYPGASDVLQYMNKLNSSFEVVMEEHVKRSQKAIRS